MRSVSNFLFLDLIFHKPVSIRAFLRDSELKEIPLYTIFNFKQNIDIGPKNCGLNAEIVRYNILEPPFIHSMRNLYVKDIPILRGEKYDVRFVR